MTETLATLGSVSFIAVLVLWVALFVLLLSGDCTEDGNDV